MIPSIETLKSQILQLQSLRDAGVLTEDSFRQACEPLERRLVDALLSVTSEMTPIPASQTPSAARPPLKLVGMLAAFVTVVGVGGYLLNAHRQAGTVVPQDAPDALTAPVGAAPAHPMTAGNIDDLAAKLAERLKSEPNNADGWLMLARSYFVLNRFPDSMAAYKHYVGLKPDDAQAWADYADAVGMANHRSLEGDAQKMIAKALSIDPNNFKALALSGSLAFSRQDYPKAVHEWEHALSETAPTPELAHQLQRELDQARERAGLEAPAASSRGLTAQSAASTVPGADVAAIRGRVSLAADLKDRVAPEDTVFIFARSAQGPRMPLAVLRKRVKDLPVSFELNDSQSMSPQFKLSTASEVVIEARISKSGNAMPESGDLKGVSASVRPGSSGVTIVIDTGI